MKPPVRALIRGMHGNDVRDLQRELVWLGSSILATELTSARFGASTQGAVQTLQTQSRIEANGIVDARTAAAINKKLSALERVVRGNALQADGQPLARAKVRAFDKALRSETQLGEATCDAAGYFEIRYVYASPDKSAPALLLKAFANARAAKTVAVSEVLFDARPEAIINLVAGGAPFRGLSEFERVLSDLKPLIDGDRVTIADLAENDEIKDVTFLSQQTGHPPDRIAGAVLAHRHAKQSALDPQLLYALFRQGMPTEPTALLSQDPRVLKRAWVEAAQSNLIPAELTTEARLDAALEALKAWRVNVALDAPADVKHLTLGALVKSVLSEEPLQRRFMQALGEHTGSVAEFWKSLDQDPQLSPRVADLKFAVLLGNLGQDHFLLVEAVRRLRTYTTVRELASLSEEGWRALLTEQGVGTPRGIEGADEADKTRRYARSLAQAVENAAPTEFLVARLRETEVAGKADLLEFFRANPSFDIKQTRPDAFLKENPEALQGSADPGMALKQLKSLHRTYRLTGASRPAIALQQAGKDSALRISRMGRNAFAARFGQHFNEPERASEVYARARQVSAAAVALIADANPAMNSVALHAVPDAVSSEVVDIPSWSSLFGSLDACSCEECLSVYSPAAYLADLLNFLQDREAKPAEPPSPQSLTVKQVLFARRPDLGEIELTCENTNTVLPYVDLVLEILEDAVAPPPAFSPFEIDSSRIADLDQRRVSTDLRADFSGVLSEHASIRIKNPGEWIIDDLSASYGVRRQASGKPKVETRGRQTSGTQQAANPQYVNPASYAALKGAVFPWRLPFDQSLEEARTYLAHLGVPRHVLIEACTAGDRATVLGDSALAHEFLGLSPVDAALITGSSPVAPWTLWGFSEELPNGVSWLTLLGPLSEFLRRSGLQYLELLNLLETRYVNGDHSLVVASADPAEPATCEIDKLTLLGLNATNAVRIARFVRLWRKLNGAPFDLDRAVRVLGGDLDAGFLVRLSHLVRLQRHFGSPADRLLVFWAALDTVAYSSHRSAGPYTEPSLYEQLFRSRASLNPLDPAFPENATALAGKLADHAAAVASALEISAADLSALIQCPSLFAPGSDIALDLDTLSILYRHSLLARATKLAVPEYLAALELIDAAPFTDTRRTLLFVESLSWVRNAGFRIGELDYLLRHRGEASSGIALEERLILDRLREFRQDLQKGTARETITRKLAETLRLEMAPFGLLEPVWTSLLDPALADANQELNAANFSQQFSDLVRLHKISVVTARLGIGKDMLAWLFRSAPAGLLDLRALPTAPATAQFGQWMRLVNLLTLRDTFFGGEPGFLELLELAFQTPSPTTQVLLEKLIQKTSWSGPDVAYLVGANGFGLTLPDDFRNETALLRLRDALALLKRLGISAQQGKVAGSDVTAEMARAIRQAARAKYDDAQWSPIAKPLRDALREKQRSALVDYLTAHGADQDANALYAHFLADVEMDPCMMTSRIKQAISSVQLFVQRCLMRLEPEVVASSEADDAWSWWKWMKSYRVWEANRKVFLYPENWLEPELRDDKSPFFRELEGELLESDLTLETAEAAFINYLQKLDAVARLEVMAVHQETERDILHVFARTQAPPRVYYYRQRVSSAYWTAWEKADLDIEGDHLIPVLWNSRLYLFWPIFQEKSEPANLAIQAAGSGGLFKDKTRKYWDMKLAWSERRQGSWSGKKVSSQSAKIEQQTAPRGGKEDGQLADLSQVYFVPVVRGHDLSIDQVFVTTRSSVAGSAFAVMARPAHPIDTGTSGGIFDPDVADNGVFDPDPGDGGGSPTSSAPFVVGSHNFFFFQGCYFDPQITPHGTSSIVMVPNALPGTARSYMWFQESSEAALNLPLHRTLAGSVPAVALTPGRYKVTTQDAEVTVTRNPFLFQDPARSYLVSPKLSWWDDSVIDPGEVGGVLAFARLGAPEDHSGELDAQLSIQPDLGLGPDRYLSAPFVRRPNTKYRFDNFYHPYVCPLLSIVNREGVDQMLRREVQLEPHKFMPGNATAPFSFEASYLPANDLVAAPFPTEEMDFSFSGSYASYNWELFFHAPLLVADRLSKNQRFAEAVQWFHYVFNPTDTSDAPSPQRYWQTRRFFETTSYEYQEARPGNLFKLLARATELRMKPNPTAEEQRDLQRLDDLEAAIRAWRLQPFKPHLVARTRTTAYQKNVVMKYIDNLIAWADQLFRRDTIETINEATQLYVLAADILGPRPVEIPPRRAPQVQTFNSLEQRLDEFSNALVEVEALVPLDADAHAESDSTPQPPPTLLYFCLPKNDKLLGYWDTVADRLFKIRHCMNILGVIRQLPLFERPIDPALLIRGVAAGLDLDSLLNDIEMPLPAHRFTVWAAKANELCAELRNFGASFLATLERRDGEELARLRAGHESGLLAMVEQVKSKQLEEASQQLAVVSASRDVILGRLSHYQRLLGESNPKRPAIGERVQEKDYPRFSEIQTLAGVKMFPHELLENLLLITAQELEGISAAQKSVGAVLYAFPEVNSMPMGVGVTQSGFGHVISAAADGTSRLASAAQFGASMTARLGSYIARELDWVLQHNQAARELAQLDKQIVAAQIRLEIAEHELRNHRKQLEDSREVEDHLRDKYTSKELYSWMVGQMSGVYFQAYDLAYAAAKRAEQCFRHELGIRDSRWIQFGYWDSLKKGLLAGEKLHHDLKRMEIAYLDLSPRELELTKHLSLAQLAPLELVRLRETGQCSLRVPEEIYDLDYPGHYFRRTKSVSLTLPCVAGPYTTISCTLRLTRSSVRINAANGGSGYARNTDNQGQPVDDSRFVDDSVPVQAIATSSAQNDSGVFELNFRDERYLPFEGTGTISEWRLELFTDATNADFGRALRQFDFGSISDAILHLKYTAREGAGESKTSAISHLREYFRDGLAAVLLLPVDLRREFGSQWNRFVNPADSANGNVFELEMLPALFPVRDAGKALSINALYLLARCMDAGDYGVTISTPQAAGLSLPLIRSETYGGLHFGKIAVSFDLVPGDPPARLGIRMERPGGGNLTVDPVSQNAEVQDAVLVFAYHWS